MLSVTLMVAACSSSTGPEGVPDTFTYCGETTGYTPSTTGQVAILNVRAGCVLGIGASLSVQPGIRTGGVSFITGIPLDTQGTGGQTTNTGTGTYPLTVGTEYFFSTALKVPAPAALCGCQTIAQVIQGEIPAP